MIKGKNRWKTIKQKASNTKKRAYTTKKYISWIRRRRYRTANRNAYILKHSLRVTTAGPEVRFLTLNRMTNLNNYRILATNFTEEKDHAKKRNFPQNNWKVPWMWEHKSHSRLWYWRDYLWSLRSSSPRTDDGQGSRMASFHSRGKGIQKPCWSAHFIFSSRQRIVHSHRSSRQGCLRA